MTFARTGLFVIFTDFRHEEWSVLRLLGSKRIHSGKKDKFYRLVSSLPNTIKGNRFISAPGLGFSLKYLCCFCSKGRYRIPYKLTGRRSVEAEIKEGKKAEEKAHLEQRKSPHGTNVPGLCG